MLKYVIQLPLKRTVLGELFFKKICFASLPPIVAVQKKSLRLTSGLLALKINGFCPSYLVAVSSKSFDLHCCVTQGSCLGQILCIMYVSGIFNRVKNHPPSIHVYADDISSCICPSNLCRHLCNMMRSEHLSKLVQLKFELG